MPGMAPRRVMEELNRAQTVMSGLVKPYLRKVEWTDQFAELLWPCGRDYGVVLDPRRCFGQPIIHADTIPTKTIYRQHVAGDAHRAIADWFDISLRSVETAVDFEQRLKQAC